MSPFSAGWPLFYIPDTYVNFVELMGCTHLTTFSLPVVNCSQSTCTMVRKTICTCDPTYQNKMFERKLFSKHDNLQNIYKKLKKLF